jgi:type IV secretion system protein VirD4
MTIANMIADPTGKMANDPKSKHWILTASALIEAVIMHLLYVHDKEHKPVPNMGDVTRFISSSSRSFDEAITEMMYYQHITPEEAFSDDNIFQKNYGDYVEINAFNDSFLETEETDSLKLRKIRSDILNISEDDLDKNSYYNDYSKFLNFSEIKAYFKDDYQNLDFEMKPYCFLLTHPRVASGAYKMASRAEEEQSSVLSTAATGFQLYQDPVISKNTAVSDFKLDDVMNYEKAVSLYLVASSADRAILQPIFRLMLDFFLRRNMKNLTERKKHKCLLLLDEFPQIGKIDQFEMAIATMAGYQLRSLIIIQNLSQLYSIYGKDTSIISNCAVRVFYTPNDDNTPKVISNMLGKETITVTSKSETNNLLKKNKSWQSAARDLMTVDEVLNLPESQEIVFINGKRPILAKKLLYYKIPFFLNRVSIWQKEDNNVLNPKYPPLLKSDYCTIVDSYTKLLPKAVEKGKLNSLSNNITLKKNTKKINSKLSVISLYILTIKNKIKTLLAKKKQQPEKIAQPNFVVKDSINELQKPKTKTSITSTEEIPVTAIEDIQQIEELEPIQNESEDNMNMLETKTDEQIPGMGDLITKQNTTKTTENEATFTDTFEDDDINQVEDNLEETVNNNKDEAKNIEKAEDNKTNQVNVATEQIPTETSTNESKPVAKSEKTIIRRKLIQRKSSSEVDIKMLSYLHDLGITNVEELNFYLDNCTLSIDETQEKIARYQQELDELAAIYDELESS